MDFPPEEYRTWFRRPTLNIDQGYPPDAGIVPILEAAPATELKTKGLTIRVCPMCRALNVRYARRLTWRCRLCIALVVRYRWEGDDGTECQED